MVVTDLHVYGSPLSSIAFNDTGDVAQFYPVECSGFLIGVGLYYNFSDTPTFALVKDDVGEKVMFGKIHFTSILRAEDMLQLEQYFYKMFPRATG